MPFSQDAGYTPSTIQTIMASIMNNVNAQFGTSYTAETFLGTNLYKYFYALAQDLQKNDVKTSEIFAKLAEYIDVTNQRISRPVVTPLGIIDKLLTEGFVASVKPMIEADAGKANICVDVDDTDPDYAETKLAICTVIKDSVVAGVVTEGTESETIVLSNGQSFDFKYHLPDRIPVLLRLTITLSENNQVLVGDPTDTRLKLFNNISERYRLGLNFEPQKYFDINDDAPWASDVLLEWSDDDGSNYYSTVFDADFDELFTFELGDIEIVEG